MLCFVMALGTLSSCGKFLNEQPTNSSNAESAISTLTDAEVVLNGIMRTMSGKDYYGRNFFLYGDVKGGDLTIMSQGRGMDYLYLFNQSAETSAGQGYWKVGYSCIMNINNLIENIEALQEDGMTGLDEYYGAAHALRAILYFDLVRLYALPYNMDKSSDGVPLVLRTLEADERPSRATVKEVFDQILSDLETAQGLMEKTPVDKYPGYYAAVAEEARVRLYMEDWTGALQACRKIIGSGRYYLYNPVEWVDSWSKQFGSESIFEIGIDTESDLETESLGFYYMAYKRVSNAAGWFLASDYYLDLLSEDPDDVRWGVMDEDEWGEINNTVRLGACYKYVGGKNLPGDGKATYSAVNVKVIRLSEIYLIAAEAALESGNRQQAADYLNEIRQRSPNLEKATASNISVDMILDERGKELFGEGQRFFDLIRRNRTIEYNDDLAGIAVTSRDKIIDRNFGKIVLPIAQSEINTNPNITQNPAYR